MRTEEVTPSSRATMEDGVEEEELNSRATRTEDCAPEVEVVVGGLGSKRWLAVANRNYTQ